jgi:hypothetical protein
VAGSSAATRSWILRVFDIRISTPDSNRRDLHDKKIFRQVRFYVYELHLDVKIVYMATTSRFPPRSSGEKDASELCGDRHGNAVETPARDISGMRARNQQPNVRRTYGNAVGNLGARDDDSTETEATHNGASRKRIRKRLEEKNNHPWHVQWIKWMNSEWKNRKSSSS